jgi:hypothetical protein
MEINIDEAIADAIIKMVMEEGGMKRSELRTDYICNFPQYNKEFDRIVDELVANKVLIEIEFLFLDDISRSFILPSNAKINIKGDSWQMNLGN